MSGIRSTLEVIDTTDYTGSWIFVNPTTIRPRQQPLVLPLEIFISYKDLDESPVTVSLLF